MIKALEFSIFMWDISISHVLKCKILFLEALFPFHKIEMAKQENKYRVHYLNEAIRKKITL